MTLAATGTCDGCEREGPIQQLERVLLPSGHTAVCCPECRYHAERLAERSSAPCQGCDDDVTVADLAIAELPDGREIRLCPDCLAEAEGLGVDSTGRPGSGSDPHRAPSAGGSEDGTAAAAGNGDGRRSGGRWTGASDHPSAGGARHDGGPSASRNGTGTGSAYGNGTGTASSAGPGTGTASSDASGPGAGTSGKPARTTNVCDQCGGEFSTELYRVKTVDDRTEELCASCKDDCVDQGIVTEVELRRAQAFEVLGITGSADDDEIREAYLERVKEVHPDREGGNRSEFMLVKQAYDRLSGESATHD